MGFEIPLDSDYPDHPKALKMIALLGKQGDIYPIRLWCWCAKYAKSGVVNGGQAEIEKAVKWSGTPGKCHAAMIESGIIKKDGKTVHDWMQHAGRKIKAYETKKENQRAKYERESSGNLPDSSGIMPESSGTQAGILPTPKEKKGKETKREEMKGECPSGKSSIDPVAELAQEFAFLGGDGTQSAAISRAYAAIADILKAGVSIEEIRAEIHSSERTRSEHPGRMRDRFLRKKSKISIADEVRSLTAWGERGNTNDQN